MAITFQAERLIGRLNVLETTQIKYAGTQAMKRLGWEMRSELGRYMQATFDRTVPFTINSALYRTTGGLSVGISINPNGDDKGQSPASYLYPLTPDGGGQALTTRFTKGLRKKGIIGPSTWALNWLPDPGTPTRNGTTDPGLLQALLSALGQSGGRLASRRSKYGQGGVRYFSVPDQRSTGRQNNTLARGIYRVKAGERPVRLMGYLDSQPRVPTKFDFERIVAERSAALLPGLLRAELDRALR